MNLIKEFLTWLKSTPERIIKTEKPPVIQYITNEELELFLFKYNRSINEKVEKEGFIKIEFINNSQNIDGDYIKLYL